MKKVNILLFVIIVMFLTSCSDLRYMTGSFRKVKNVAKKYKDKKVAIIMSGFSHDSVKRFENGLKTLGYNIIGDVSDCYKGRMESLKSFNHDDWFYIQKECGQTIDANLVIIASLGNVTSSCRKIVYFSFKRIKKNRTIPNLCYI